MVLNLRILHEIRHRGQLAMARSAFGMPTWHVLGGPAKNHLALFFGLYGYLDYCRQSVDKVDMSNVSIQRRYRAYRTGPTDSAGMYQLVRKLAIHRRNACPPAATAEWLPGRVDNRLYNE